MTEPTHTADVAATLPDPPPEEEPASYGEVAKACLSTDGSLRR